VLPVPLVLLVPPDVPAFALSLALLPVLASPSGFERSPLVLLPVSLLVSRRRLRSAALAQRCWRSSKIARNFSGLAVAEALPM